MNLVKKIENSESYFLNKKIKGVSLFTFLDSNDRTSYAVISKRKMFFTDSFNEANRVFALRRK